MDRDDQTASRIPYMRYGTKSENTCMVNIFKIMSRYII